MRPVTASSWAATANATSIEVVDGVILTPWNEPASTFLEEAGALALEHRTPDRPYNLAASCRLCAAPRIGRLQLDNLRTNEDMVAERDRVASSSPQTPDKTVALIGEMDMGEPELYTGATLAYGERVP